MCWWVGGRVSGRVAQASGAIRAIPLLAQVTERSSRGGYMQRRIEGERSRREALLDNGENRCVRGEGRGGEGGVCPHARVCRYNYSASISFH